MKAYWEFKVRVETENPAKKTKEVLDMICDKGLAKLREDPEISKVTIEHYG